MSLLSDFKIRLGITGSDNDQYLIDYYLAPSIRKVSDYYLNVKMSVITLISGDQSYDLTQDASPAVSNGIQDMYFDHYSDIRYLYKQDYYITDNGFTLYFIDPETPSTGDWEIMYNEYFSIPTLTPTYTETDLPTNFFPSVVKHASARYNLDLMVSQTNNTIQSKSEMNMTINYGTVESRRNAYVQTMQEAEKEFANIGATSKSKFFSTSII